jgi:hypothetical protein
MTFPKQSAAPAQDIADRLADDLLVGVPVIARELGWPEPRVYHAIANDRLPHTRLGRRIIASRRALKRHFQSPKA